MFNIPELMIDAVQNGKKQFINKYITNPSLARAWTEYVNSQTEFLHVSIKTSTTVVTTMGREFMETKVEKIFNPFSIDWMKAGWDAWMQQSTANKS
jgi:hypothetical protein